MTISRLLCRTGLPLLLAASTACDAPTAPELFSTADRIEAELLRDSSGAPRSSIWFRMGADDLAARMPAAGPVELLLDGRRRTFRGFVFERVVVPLDTADGVACPHVTRALMAGWGNRMGVVAHSASVPSLVRPAGECGSPPGSEIVDTAFFAGSAQVIVYRPGDEPVMVGRSGEVDIRPVGAVEGACDFLEPEDAADNPVRVECVVVQFQVRADALLRRQDAGPMAPVSGVRRLSAAWQVVPGIRLTLFCTELTNVRGCGGPPR